jgi:hypothetical protein
LLPGVGLHEDSLGQKTNALILHHSIGFFTYPIITLLQDHGSYQAA